MTILDASAVLALLQDEVGADEVEDAVDRGACISAVNLGEVLGKMVDAGTDAGDASELIGGLFVSVEPFELVDAVEIADLRKRVDDRALSPGDRSCLALARRRGESILTADRAWLPLAERLAVEIASIR